MQAKWNTLIHINMIFIELYTHILKMVEMVFYYNLTDKYIILLYYIYMVQFDYFVDLVIFISCLFYQSLL